MNLDQMFEARTRALASGWTPERVRAKVPASGAAKVYVDDMIHAWGFPYGISAKDFRQTLAEITSDHIELHINSPGGDAFEGVAMFNAARQHDARITVVVDGLAGSAASLLAMAGDDIVMCLGTQMFVHDPWAVAAGNAEVMADTSARLDKLAHGYAEVYAERTGRTIDEARALMRDDAWLNADEAIEQGFADRKDDRDGTEDNAKAKALLEPNEGLSINGTLTTSGNVTIHGDSAAAIPTLARATALASQTPPLTEPVASTTQPTPEVTVAEDAANDQVTGSESESPPTAITPVAVSAAGPDHLAEINRLSSQVADMQAREAARDKAEFFETALSQGRVSPAERTELEGMYDAAPDQTKAFVLARAVGSMVPVAAIGHEGSGEAMSEYEALYGKEG